MTHRIRRSLVERCLISMPTMPSLAILGMPHQSNPTLTRGWVATARAWSPPRSPCWFFSQPNPKIPHWLEGKYTGCLRTFLQPAHCVDITTTSHYRSGNAQPSCLCCELTFQNRVHNPTNGLFPALAAQIHPSSTSHTPHCTSRAASGRRG